MVLNVAACLHTNVTIYSTDIAARSDRTICAIPDEADVDEAISQAQAIHEDSRTSASRARAGRTPIALTGIAGRVMVKEVNWLGDLVISLPALRSIRAAFATSTLTVMVKKELANFFDGMTWVDEVIPYTVRRGVRGIRDRMNLIGKIRERHFDLAILLPNSFESALWATLGGARRRAGFNTDRRGAMLTHRATPEGDARDGVRVSIRIVAARC